MPNFFVGRISARFCIGVSGAERTTVVLLRGGRSVGRQRDMLSMLLSPYLCNIFPQEDRFKILSLEYEKSLQSKCSRF